MDASAQAFDVIFVCAKASWVKAARAAKSVT